MEDSEKAEPLGLSEFCYLIYKLDTKVKCENKK